jgi:Fe-S-cluster containining protein
MSILSPELLRNRWDYAVPGTVATVGEMASTLFQDTFPSTPFQPMIIEDEIQPDSGVTCASCEACCCRLEVMLITDTGVPGNFVEIDEWGGMTMARLGDGWCSALDRNTMTCMIYEKRPLICREFEMGEYECISERIANLTIVGSASLGTSQQ